MRKRDKRLEIEKKRERKRCKDRLQLSALLWAISLRYKFSTVNLKYKDNS